MPVVDIKNFPRRTTIVVMFLLIFDTFYAYRRKGKWGFFRTVHFQT